MDHRPQRHTGCRAVQILQIGGRVDYFDARGYFQLQRGQIHRYQFRLRPQFYRQRTPEPLPERFWQQLSIPQTQHPDLEIQLPEPVHGTHSAFQPAGDVLLPKNTRRCITWMCR